MRRGRDERGEGAADGKARPIFSGGERSEACDSDDDASKSWSRVRIRWSRVESSSPASRALSRNVRLPHHNVIALRTSAASAGTSPPRRVARIAVARLSEAARFWKQPPCPRVRGERGGQRGRTTDGTGTNDRRAKRATRRPTGRRAHATPTQARLERSGKPRPLGTVAREYAPSRNPFLKRRGRVLRYLMRPVPVVRRPMARGPVVCERGGGWESHRRDFAKPSNPRFCWSGGWRWDRDTYSSSCGPRVAARAARGLLDVEGATTTPAMSRGRRARSRQSIASKTLNSAFFFAIAAGDATAGSFGDVPPAQRVALVPPLAEAPGTFADLTHG